MKIKVCKEHWLDEVIYDIDRRAALNHDDKSYLSDYSSKYDEEEVTEEQLMDYIKKGYAIKINC